MGIVNSLFSNHPLLILLQEAVVIARWESSVVLPSYVTYGAQRRRVENGNTGHNIRGKLKGTFSPINPCTLNLSPHYYLKQVADVSGFKHS